MITLVMGLHQIANVEGDTGFNKSDLMLKLDMNLEIIHWHLKC